MANQLKMADVHTILTLREQHWSYRRIAKELGIDRDTVSRHVEAARAVSNAAKAPTGSDAVCEVSNAAKAPTGSDVEQVANLGQAPARLAAAAEGSNAAKAPLGWGAVREADVADTPMGGEGLTQAALATGATPATVATNSESCSEPSRSDCEPWREQILAKISQGLSAQRIYQDLFGAPKDKKPSVSYWSVRRFVKQLRVEHPLPFRRMETAPGAEGQVDFGQGAPVERPDGKRRRPHVLRVVLSFSRKGYSEAVWRQSTDDFIRCLENAFWSWGGVPRTLVIDNLRAAVSKPDWFDPELNPKIQAFCRHYGVAILPTKPYMPRHKGKIENGVDYVQENGLRGHQFTSLEAENAHLLNWETTVADTRIHGTTRQQVGKMFSEVEKPALLPLPAERFPFFHESKRIVHRDGHVEVEKAYYSVPVEYLGHEVWVRWDGRLVRIFNLRMEQIALHVQQEAGRFSTSAQHIVREKTSMLEKGATWLLNKASCIGPHSAAWAQAMLKERGIEGVRVLMGLIHLGGQHACCDVERACEIALSHGAFHLRTLRALIQRPGGEQQQFGFVDEHPIIRSLTEYGQVVRAAITGQQPRKEIGHERQPAQDVAGVETLGTGGQLGRAAARGGRQSSEPSGVPGVDLPG